MTKKSIQVIEFPNVSKCISYIFTKCEGLNRVKILFTIIDESYWKDLLLENGCSNIETISYMEKNNGRKWLTLNEIMELMKFIENNRWIEVEKTGWKEYFEVALYLPRLTIHIQPALCQIIEKKLNSFTKIFSLDINTAKYWDYNFTNEKWNVRSKIPLTIAST